MSIMDIGERHRGETLSEVEEILFGEEAIPVYREVAKPFYVYRLLNAHEELLYVGCTGDINERIWRHKFSHFWSQEICRFSFERFTDEPQALNREAKLIRTLMPKYNVRGKPKDPIPEP